MCHYILLTVPFSQANDLLRPTALGFLFIYLFYFAPLNLLMGVGQHVPWFTCEGQREILGNLFSPILWALGIDFWWSVFGSKDFPTEPNH